MRYLLFLLAFIFVFCKNEAHRNQLIVTHVQALREEAGEKSREIRGVQQGEKVTELGEISAFETPLLFDDTLLFAPWVKVETADNQTGWLYSMYLKPVSGDFDKWLLDKRLNCYFGSKLAARYEQFIAVDNAGTQSDLAARYREAVFLRDTLTYLIARRSDPNNATNRPDFFWLSNLLPGFVFQWVAEGTQPYLFTDYRFWKNKSAQTEGLQDDAFFHACITAFPTDSIESFFPAWKFQISEYEAASQLGTGIHFAMLRQIESALHTGDLFKPELMAFKESLMDDILDKKSVYWQPKELIIKELNQILNSKFSCLNDRDRVALQARLTMFENPEENNLRVNLRGGQG